MIEEGNMESTKKGRGRPCMEDQKRGRRVSVRMMESDFKRLKQLQGDRSINQVLIDLIRAASPGLCGQ